MTNYFGIRSDGRPRKTPHPPAPSPWQWRGGARTQSPSPSPGGGVGEGDLGVPKYFVKAHQSTARTRLCRILTGTPYQGVHLKLLPQPCAYGRATESTRLPLAKKLRRGPALASGIQYAAATARWHAECGAVGLRRALSPIDRRACDRSFRWFEPEYLALSPNI